MRLKQSSMVISALCVLMMFTTQAHAQEATTHSPVSLAGTEVRSLTSSHTGRNYDIYIQPVADTTGKRYPAVYLLDAQWDFPMITGIHGGLHADNFVPSTFLIGITYSGNPNYGALRAMDMTPTPQEGMDGSGEASKFLSFIKEELIPFIESEYHVDSANRTLMGSSFGGLFTTYALLHEPDLFQQYVAPSSSFWWDDGVIFQYEEALAKQRSDLPVKLYMTAGEFEGEGMIGPMHKLEKVLESRNYPNLQMEAVVVKGARHSSVKPESFMRGLRYVFAPDTVSLGSELLEPMVGRYKLDIPDPDTLIVAISLENSQLYLEMEWDGQKRALYAESDTTFFFKDITGRITVERKENDPIMELKVDQGGGFSAHRID